MGGVWPEHWRSNHFLSFAARIIRGDWCSLNEIMFFKKSIRVVEFGEDTLLFSRVWRFIEEFKWRVVKSGSKRRPEGILNDGCQFLKMKARNIYESRANVFVSEWHFYLDVCFLKALETQMRQLLLLLISVTIFPGCIEGLGEVVNRKIWIVQNLNKTIHFSMGLCGATRILPVKQKVNQAVWWCWSCSLSSLLRLIE